MQLYVPFPLKPFQASHLKPLCIRPKGMQCCHLPSAVLEAAMNFTGTESLMWKVS